LLEKNPEKTIDAVQHTAYTALQHLLNVVLYFLYWWLFKPGFDASAFFMVFIKVIEQKNKK